MDAWRHNVEGADSGRLIKPVTADKFKDKVAYSCMSHVASPVLL